MCPQKSNRSPERDMDDEDALVGGSEDDEEQRSSVERGAKDDEEDEEEGEEPEGMVEDEEEDTGPTLSECTTEYNRQHSQVPNRNKVRDHERPHVVATPEKLGEMKASTTTASRWPMANQIDPAAIVVLSGRIKEEDPNEHFVWYMRVVVEGREDDSDDKNALLHIPRGTCKDLLTLMAKDDQLCESSLINTYMPTNYNEQRILPKLNGWDPLKTAPKTIAVKPKAAGAGGKTKADERETADSEVTRDPKSGSMGAGLKKPKGAPPAPKPKAPPPSGAKPPTKKATATGVPAGKSSAHANVAGSKPGSKPANPFEKAKAAATGPKESKNSKDKTPAANSGADLPLGRVPTYDPGAVGSTDEPGETITSDLVADTGNSVETLPTGAAAEQCSLHTARSAQTVEYTFNNRTKQDSLVTFKVPADCASGKAVITYTFA
jgi:hypothetical protein